MNLRYRRIEEEDKKIICDWQYEREYAIYNFKSYEEQKECQSFLFNPEMQKNYYSIFDGDLLVAFINLMEEECEIFLGIAVNSDVLNQGYGKESIKIACEISDELYPDKPMYLEVRTFNKRAINCYKAAGFEIDGAPFTQTTHIGEGEFYRMIRKK